MIGPSTSACPVAVTVLGKPKPRKSPCARTDPDENNIKTETKTANRNFILLAYSAGVYSEPAPEQKQHTTNRQKTTPAEAGAMNYLDIAGRHGARDCSLCKFTSALQGSALSETFRHH